MSGICGVLHASGPPVEAELVQSMADSLRLRGPDDEVAWCSPDGRVGLGHRRLSIIDLSPAGHQPMKDATGRL